MRRYKSCLITLCVLLAISGETKANLYRTIPFPIVNYRRRNVIQAASFWNFPGGVAAAPYDSQRSVNLGGTDECLTVADNNAWDNPIFCVGFDFKGSTQAASKVAFSHYNYNANADMAWSVWSDSTSGRFNFIVSDNGAYDSTHTKDYKTSLLFSDNTWHSWKFCFNGTQGSPAGKIRIWRDSTEDTTLTKSQDPAITTTFNSLAPLAVGCDHSTIVTRADFFVGRFDRVYYANTDLSATNMGTGSAKTDLSGVSGVTDLWDVLTADSSTSVANQITGARGLTGNNLEGTDIDSDI